MLPSPQAGAILRPSRLDGKSRAIHLQRHGRPPVPDILKTVGRYEILREVGRGGMAMVYLARQTDLDRFVALKELAAFHASDAAFAQRFLRESRVAGSLSHPNIVTVHDYFEHDGTPYIAMEYVERGSLRPFVGNMTLSQIGGVLEGLLAGLALAEQHGVVHRDLKPENLMVTSDGRVKIADFGIAKATKQMQTGAFLTATGTTVGTPTYMAPEQAMAQEIGPWTDLYSVGCMAFEMFTGRVPFHDSDAPMAILLRHVNEEIPAVKSIDPSVDQGISDWIDQLLVKDPKERTQSANLAWDEFEELIIGLLGPRWRRAARLSGRTEQLDTPKPLTPAPFEGAPDESASDEFQSFAWGEPMPGSPPGPATPPPSDAPSGPLSPGPIDVPTGPPTPPPLERVAESGFVTFGAPPAEEAPAPAAHAAPPAPVEPAAAAPVEPAAAAPVEPAAAPASPAPSAGDESGFVTFGAPAPPDDDVVVAPRDEAAAAPPRHEIVAAPRDEVAAPPDEIVGAHGNGVDAPAFETYAPPPPRPPVGEPPATAPPPEPAVAAAAPPHVTTPPPAPAVPTEDGGATVAPAVPAEDGGETVAPAVPAEDGGETVASAVPAEDGGATVAPAALRRAPEEAPARARRSRAFPAALVGGLVVAVVAGIALGGSGGGGGGGEPSGVPVTPAAAGAVQLKLPEGYAEMSSAPALPGLDLVDGAAYAPGGKDGGRAVTFGQADANDSTLLPAQFRKALGLATGEVPERSAVKLGPDGLEAYRYEALEPAGSSRRVTVYASPTSEGVATVACLAPPADAAAFKGECEGIANTLQIASGKPFPVGPDPEYGKTLGTTFGKLDRQVASGRKALARDKTTFRAQSAAAGGIRDAYAAAAKKLRATVTSPADALINAALTERLRAASGAWKKAASTAAKKDKRGFARSAAGIKRTQSDLAGTLRGLEKVGYKLPQ